MKKKLQAPLMTLICVLLIFGACNLFDKDDDNPDNQLSDSIETGQVIEEATTTIPVSGGSIKVANPDSPIDGMEIKIPENSFSSGQEFKISYAEIKSHKLGEYVTPITPLITIEYNGNYSASPMEITIPIQLPEGDFAMAFFYDERTGKLEGLPVLKLSSSSITVTTRHFMSGTALSDETSGLKSAAMGLNSMAKMIISSISESTLKNQTVINSGYKPGQDDWEFINYGSYLSPSGHCAGQSMTSMWYYYEKKLNGEPNLFHNFDLLNKNTEPGFMWQDNPLGYRFASTIQEDFNFTGWINSLNLQSFVPGLVFKAFAAAILVTGEPQFVLINNSAGQGGHAMIVYKVNFNEGKLYIADPNYPNNRESSNGSESIRTIDLVGGTLKAYETGLTAGANSTTMDQIGYFGKTAYIDWPQIGKRYAELVNKSIGTVAPNTFPPYTIWVKGSVDQELKDGFISGNDTLRCMVECPTTNRGFHIGAKWFIWHQMFDKDGKEIGTDEGAGKGYTLLKPGQNKIGIYIISKKTSATYSNGSFIPLFVDFKWITVNYFPLTIDPNPLQGEPDKEYMFTAQSKGSAPKSAKYIWDFGDGSSPLSVQNDSTVKHTFTKEGTFSVKVELYDNSSNKKVTETTATATISKEGDLLAKLKKTIAFNLEGSLTFSRDNPNWVDINTSFSWPYSSQNPIVWDNNVFKLNYKDEEEFDSNGFKSNYYHTVTGTVSADAKMIVSLIYEEKFEYYRYNEWFETHVEKITITDIPLIHVIGDIEWGWGPVDDFLYKLEVNQAKPKISFCEWSWKDKDGKTEVLGVSNIKQFDEPIEAKFMEKFPY